MIIAVTRHASEATSSSVGTADLPKESRLTEVMMMTEDSARPSVAKRSCWNPFYKVSRFYRKMTDPRYNIKVDVYVYMFLNEFLALLVIIFGFTSFGPSTGLGDNAFEYLKANRIPMYFVWTAATQFIFIIIDRSLFLRKNVFGKFLFQLIHVVLIHFWLFFLLPTITAIPFRNNVMAQLLYVIKCVYFGLSAYQIRSNYPHRILGNFLTKNYNYLNLVLFKAYMVLPFLYELRSVMDWMWTKSTLSLYHWMEMEDIYAKLFIMKCWRRSELEFPTPRGNNRSYLVKYSVGGLVIAFCFLCLWLPIFVSSFIELIYVVNVPDECTFSLAFGGFTPFFIFTARSEDMLEITPADLQNLTEQYRNDKEAYGFIKLFETHDIVDIRLPKFSDDNWSISPPAMRTLIEKLNCTDKNREARLSQNASRDAINVNFVMKCRRPMKEVESSSRTIEEVFSRAMTLEEQCDLSRILSDSYSEKVSLSELRMVHVFPKFILAKADRLMLAPSGLQRRESFGTIVIAWERNKQFQSYWTVREEDKDHNQKPISLRSFNDRVSDNVIGKLILGFYAAYLLFASRLLRMLYNNIAYVVCKEELPHVDRVLNMCHEIYLVREYGLLRLEEQLYARLLFLYRSSETLIKWTRHPRYLVEAHTDPPGDHTSDPSGLGTTSSSSNPSPHMFAGSAPADQQLRKRRIA
ncbi:Piezo-type mechanosensitive ion channel component [Cichlidogyrus casuarinus]|uniref:Piezo-type mechanosensitive ion channel component n=1 Tax=Cichlidogyrus casuarinus TaxID=1844966 RepID=A0ABD2QNI6_9PLAT